MTRTPPVTITHKSTDELVRRTRDLLNLHERLCIKYYNPIYIVQSQQVLLLLNNVVMGISILVYINIEPLEKNNEIC